MNVVVFASRKGGSGKSSLAAHLGSYMAENARPTLLIDADPQGSLALWHRIRGSQDLALHMGTKHLTATLAKARRAGAEWVLIDTPPNADAPVAEAIWHADLVVIPMRPGLFDVDAVQATIKVCRELKKPYAVVINAAPAKNGSEDPMVADARGAMRVLDIPTWGGQITHRPELSLSLAHGAGVNESHFGSAGSEEIGSLWRALTKSFDAMKAMSGTQAQSA
ncbi:ParA family protein [Microvirga lotononidis]|uniref:ATPase involved in chromosome partitioning n=1 Tax=Microvirga lotononidis TaxID=864069 RepID=I4Z2B7_9HYPH|nr:ParA family protein [Microvirga lotononidis]EIM30359.1 ATPase involved in chromosome partitioning [Microvirga lotononidis]WQO30856.1 ParA family protein [Microvirga lotononidis]